MSKKEKPQTDPDLGVWTPAVIKHNLESLSDEEFKAVYRMTKKQLSEFKVVAIDEKHASLVKVEKDKAIKVKTIDESEEETAESTEEPKPAKKAAKKTAKKAANKKSKEVNND